MIPYGRRHAMAQRGREQRALARRPQTGTAVDEGAARAECLTHLRAARVAALEARLIGTAAELQTMIRLVEA